MSRLPSLLFLGHLLSLASTTPPAPTNVTVRSQNFQHVLTWQPADVSGPSLFYRVQYLNIIGDRNVYIPKHCSNTSNLKCDLTDELTDVMGLYSLRVQSLSPIGDGSTWAFTQFNPLEGTVLGPPIVHLSACESCINITIQPPVSHLKSPDKTRTQSLLDVYHMLKYVVVLMGPRGIYNEGYSKDLPGAGLPFHSHPRFGPKASKDIRSRKHAQIKEEVAVENFTKVIDNLLPKSNYCVSVIATATSNLNEFEIPSAFKCIVTESSGTKTGAESTIWTIAFGVLIAVVVLTLLIILYATGLICLRAPPFPKALCNVLKSESGFSGNEWKILTEKVWHVEVVFKEKKKREYDSEEMDESDTEVICEDYATRTRVCASSSNVADSSSSGDSKTLADSSLVDGSGHEAVLAAPIDSEEPQSIVSDESGASKDMTPFMDIHSSSAALDHSGSFNVDLASVKLGILPKLQEDDAASEASSQGDPDSSVSSQDSSAPLLAFDFNLLMDKLGTVGSELPAVSDDRSSNEELITDESEGDDPEQNRVSEYMSR